ncbi:DNA replication protein DnaD [Lottiidibacillus patelloidae]|uniref:DNA replication protein DnaD n=1 Tax=Lottiidibacillus patelloidae TaxID=2670334 RepID=A0A263BVF0_9BACI|nr:DnaD domain-containing protein [Lottiidibacillus patelloidae]OZM57307.1 DNA replication protein DnaD [Lottiidibacillus patelloidae]
MEKTSYIKWITSGNVSVPMLLLENYKKLQINELETMLLIHLHSYIEKGNYFPTPEDIASRMTCTVEQCCDILRKFIQRGFISIEDQVEHISNVRTESYSLLPLWEKLFTLLNEQGKEKEQQTKVKQEESLYTIFEREFARPLSPMECETLSLWIDQDGHTTELITAALREAVISGKMNIRYIDRILYEWKRNGIKTVEQAKEHGKKFRSYNKQPEVKSTEDNNKPKEKSTTPFYHWLEKP